MLKNLLIASSTIFLLATSNLSTATPAQAEKLSCVGFAFIISIQSCRSVGDGPKAVVSDYCRKLKGKVDRLKFTKTQTAVLDRSQKELLASIILDYRETCLKK